jgi:hypothetical protein
MDADSERAFEQFVRERSAALFRTAYLVTGDAPQTEVQVTGQPLPGRYALRIEDRGIGMSDNALARVNRQLADPPLVGFASSPVIGLLAAGRLAQRHGIRVRLGHTAPGGTEALVLLPEALLVRRTARPAVPVEPLPI